MPVVPSPDTVKVIHEGMVSTTVDRASVGLAQTPQAFRTEVLREVHKRAAREGRQATDDAMLLEEAGYRVAAVEGEPGNFKITTPEDLRRAEALVEAQAAGTPT